MKLEILPGVRLHTDFPCGNLHIDKIEGSTLHVGPDLRDCANWWCYWNFCVSTDRDVTLRFVFGENLIGYYGPAVSRDGAHWQWMHAQNATEMKEFSFSFRTGETVYLAHNMVYPAALWNEFLQRNNLRGEVFCKSNQGRDVPLLRLGEGTKKILLLSRNHACESTGTYLLQGVAEEWLKAPVPGYELVCLPFVDIDGVMRGDIGKGRTPHDHNRDYQREPKPLYREVEAILDYVDAQEVPYLFDFHSPWHWKKRSDHVFAVMRSACQQKMTAFLTQLEEEVSRTPEAIQYRMQNNIEVNEDWNLDNNAGRSYACTAEKPENQIAFTLETPYFGLGAERFSQAHAVALGRCFGRVLRNFIST